MVGREAAGTVETLLSICSRKQRAIVSSQVHFFFLFCSEPLGWKFPTPFQAEASVCRSPQTGQRGSG